MKRSKRLFVLVGVLVTACAATFALTRFEEEKEQIKATGEIVLELSAEDIRAFSWIYGDTQLGFHKDGVWRYDGDEAFPVDEKQVNRMLEQFEAFGVSFVIEDVTDYGMYGLEDPACTIVLETEEQTYEVQLGDFSNMDQERYISIGDGNAYLAKVDPLDEFDVQLEDMILHDEDLAYDRISSITFRGEENYTIYYEEDSPHTYCPDDVYFVQQEDGVLPLDTQRVASWLENLTTLNPTEYVTYNATQEELEAYDLVEPELTVTVEHITQGADGEESTETFVLSVSRDPEELAAAERAEADGEEGEDVNAHVRIGDSPIVYRVSEYACNSLRAVSCNDLRHREVIPADFDQVSQIDVVLEGESYTVAVDGERDGQPVWKYLEEEVDAEDLLYELETLDAEYAVDFTTDAPTGKEEIALTVHLDDENHPKVEIGLYRHDGESCLAVVDGEPFALVPRSDAVEVVEAVNAIVLNE